MAFDGQIGHLKTKEETIVTGDHPPIILTGLIDAAAGAAPWPAGLILTRGESGLLSPWDGKTGAPVGVLTEDLDPAKSGAALYLAHGAAALAGLKLAEGATPAGEQIYALARAGIYGV